MKYLTPELCDKYPDLVRVVEPIFKNYGGKSSFGGQIVTIKCHEDNSVVKETAGTAGNGKIIVVDGGGSLRRALLGDLIAENAVENGWEGFIIYGCIRDVDSISTMNLGVKALNTNPLKTEKKGIGDLNIPVSFGGATFKPGEYVYADSNGIIVSSKPLNNT
ncbi:MAG: ribonuclease E activity regulator RraA [Candidatus Dadabacteria bacterium]|nr:ribonuclease E activity regulator RraA [Candidatus Dadabacteria bacterium]